MTKASTDTVAGRLLVLSGPPGSGKTTIARALADSAGRPTVHLATDLFYVAIRKGFVPPFLPEAAKQNTVIIDVIVDAIAREGRELKASGPIKGLYGAFANLGALEQHAMDTSGEVADATTLRVRNAVARGEFVVSRP